MTDTRKIFIAYPTIILFFLGFFLIYFSINLRFNYNYSWVYTLPISICANYILFPVIHDGSHKTISNNTMCNEVISYIAGIPFFFAPFPTWRFIHLRHHRFTNIPDKDPDYYAGGGITNKLVLVLRWMTHIFHYYSYVFQELVKVLYTKIRKKCIRNNVCEIENIRKLPYDTSIQNNTCILLITILFIITNLYITYYAYNNNFLTDLCVLWIIPSAITVMILSLLFDYLPHRYYETNIQESKYKITNMTHGLLNTKGSINKIIAALTFNQLTYHNIHHLYPKLPFYKYPQVWEEKKELLIEKGTPIQSIF